MPLKLEGVDFTKLSQDWTSLSLRVFFLPPSLLHVKMHYRTTIVYHNTLMHHWLSDAHRIKQARPPSGLPIKHYDDDAYKDAHSTYTTHDWTSGSSRNQTINQVKFQISISASCDHPSPHNCTQIRFPNDISRARWSKW